MNKGQKRQELLDLAEALKREVYHTLGERLSPEDKGLLEMYVSLSLRHGLLDGSIRRGPNFDEAEMWDDLEKVVLQANAQLEELPAVA